ncbi:MAG: LysR family transcriptional regulator [Bacillota bacterium]|jgi:DNA-binding transcriptional LysR family regulator
MDLKKYEAFLSAVDCGSFSKAAVKLGYTQSGLTHMMNSLEEAIGFPILARGHYGIKLTEHGEALIPLIRQLMEANSKLENAITEINQHEVSTIRIGSYTSISLHWLPSILQAFQQSHPQVALEIQNTSIEENYRWLREGKVDMVFGSKQQNFKDLQWIPLRDDPLKAILPKDYPLSGKNYFPLSDFDNAPFLMPAMGFDLDIMPYFKTENINPRVKLTSMDDPTIMAMVERGIGTSILSELVVTNCRNDVRIMDLEPYAYRQLGIALRKGQERTQAVQKFVACAKKTVAEMYKEK